MLHLFVAGVTARLQFQPTSGLLSLVATSEAHVRNTHSSPVLSSLIDPFVDRFSRFLDPPFVAFRKRVAPFDSLLRALDNVNSSRNVLQGTGGVGQSRAVPHSRLSLLCVDHN